MGFFNACAQVAGKNGWLAGNIKGVLARLRAYVEYLSLLNDYHALRTDFAVYAESVLI